MDTPILPAVNHARQSRQVRIGVANTARGVLLRIETEHGFIECCIDAEQARGIAHMLEDAAKPRIYSPAAIGAAN